MSQSVKLPGGMSVAIVVTSQVTKLTLTKAPGTPLTVGMPYKTLCAAAGKTEHKFNIAKKVKQRQLEKNRQK